MGIQSRITSTNFKTHTKNHQKGIMSSEQSPVVEQIVEEPTCGMNTAVESSSPCAIAAPCAMPVQDCSPCAMPVQDCMPCNDYNQCQPCQPMSCEPCQPVCEPCPPKPVMKKAYRTEKYQVQVPYEKKSRSPVRSQVLKRKSSADKSSVNKPSTFQCKF